MLLFHIHLFFFCYCFTYICKTCSSFKLAFTHINSQPRMRPVGKADNNTSILQETLNFRETKSLCQEMTEID